MQIFVGDARLSLNVISAYTDESGKVKETQESLQTTIGESKEQTFSTSNTVSNETTLKFGQKIGTEVSYGKEGFGVKMNVEYSAGQTIANGFTATTDRETAETATKEYQNSVSNGFTQSEGRSVTRTAETAEIVADVSIQNQGDIAFTISNIELSVLQQDRRKANRFVPITALRLEGADDPKDQPSFNLGPFDPQRGPLIFKNSTIFPSLVEQYLREPQGLIYKVVNFDLTDEFGRNFVFSNQDVNDHTAGITIDYGNGESESYRVATNNLYDADGKLKPITMQRALEIVGFTRSADASGDTANADASSPATMNSYGTQRGAGGVEVLTRIRGTQTDFASPSPEKRFWAVISAGSNVANTQDFNAIELRARDNIQLVFTRDQDKDGLLEREEIYYGSSDTAIDSDGDDLLDTEEVRDGWSVIVKGSGSRKVFSSPAMPDSDLDGLTDGEEKWYGTDPTQADSDLDGLSDKDELRGPLEILLYDGDTDETNNRLVIVPSYQGQVIMTGPDGICNTTKAGDDEQVVPTGGTAGWVAVKAGPNRVLDSIPGGDDYVSVAHDRVYPANKDDNKNDAGATTLYRRVSFSQDPKYLTDPLYPDTDQDGVNDGREVVLGIDPNHQDAGSVVDNDNDGLTDDEENAGWKTANGAMVKSSNLSADTDRDGLPDVYERALGSNPRSRDTDGDTLFDFYEFDPSNPNNIYNGQALAEAQIRCEDASNCNYARPDSERMTGTDPSKKDTDDDGLTDLEELTGSWYVDLKNPAQARREVTSDPRFADKDQDGMDDGVERDLGTDPGNPDTDGDGYKDGDEPDLGLNPLRQDYWLTVTLTDVRVDDDCDATTCEGLELVGDFWLRSPNGSETLLQRQKSIGEMCACEVQNCCEARICPGQSFSWSKSVRFKFQDGETFTLGTSELGDNDHVGDAQGVLQPIGSFNKEFPFSLTLQDTFTQPVVRRLQDHDQLHVHEGEVKGSPGVLQARSIARPVRAGAVIANNHRRAALKRPGCYDWAHPGGSPLVAVLA